MIFAILGYLLSALILVPIALYLLSLYNTKNDYINRIAYQMVGVLVAVLLCIVWICIRPMAWWALLIEFVALCCIANVAVKIYRKRE